jgi:SAM-dependent methyltransferase
VTDYYKQKLAADRLARCYEIASPRVRQYLRAEMDFVVSRLRETSVVLDLGCGYGRTLPDLVSAAAIVVGIDTSEASLALARERISAFPSCLLARMDATALSFVDATFDVVVCIQNGMCAFRVDKQRLIEESLRVLRPGGVAMFSAYAERFWPHRLSWFNAQAETGLIGPIDRQRTRDGVIVCEDGLILSTVRPEEFSALVAGLDVQLESVEVDESSQFYVLTKPRRDSEEG